MVSCNFGSFKSASRYSRDSRFLPPPLTNYRLQVDGAPGSAPTLCCLIGRHAMDSYALVRTIAVTRQSSDSGTGAV
jgi:hypothetical protein